MVLGFKGETLPTTQNLTVIIVHLDSPVRQMSVYESIMSNDNTIKDFNLKLQNSSPPFDTCARRSRLCLSIINHKTGQASKQELSHQARLTAQHNYLRKIPLDYNIARCGTNLRIHGEVPLARGGRQECVYSSEWHSTSKQRRG